MSFSRFTTLRTAARRISLSRQSGQVKQWQRTARRGYADDHGAHGGAKGSDLPWIIGSVAITVPGTYFILNSGGSPGNDHHLHQGSAHGEGKGEELDESTETDDSMTATHALNDGEDSIVPLAIQKVVPESVERALPNFIHNTGESNSDSMKETHALNDGEDSIVPKAVQKVVPESVERALPNSIHNTGDDSTESESDSMKTTHAKDDGDDSIVPKAVQKVVPEGVERALPNSIHNTGDDETNDETDAAPAKGQQKSDDKPSGKSSDKSTSSGTTPSGSGKADKSGSNKIEGKPAKSDNEGKTAPETPSDNKISEKTKDGDQSFDKEHEIETDSPNKTIHKPDAKGGAKRRVESANAISLHEESEDNDETDKAAASKKNIKKGSMADKQAGLSNTDTKHSTDPSLDDTKSTKAEGAPETAKLQGTVKPDRPAR